MNGRERLRCLGHLDIFDGILWNIHGILVEYEWT